MKVVLSLFLVLLVWKGEVQAQPGSKDFIDSPFVGQGTPPANGVDVYMSTYLDRLLHLNQLEYYFHVRMPWLAFQEET
jgi:hypothetical protein